MLPPAVSRLRKLISKLRWFAPGARENNKVESMNLNPPKIASQLAAAVRADVQINKSLAPYTSYQIGGPTAVWVAPSEEGDIGRILALVNHIRLPLFILGRGSNVLISDRGWDGITLYLGANLSDVRFDGEVATALAGTLLLDVVRAAVKRGLAGMEQLAGIPGGIGGALRMNAGAFGQEIASTTRAVRGFRRNGSPFQAARDDSQTRTLSPRVWTISLPCVQKSSRFGIPPAAVCLSVPPAIMPGR
jgi:hypothetical protein